MRRSLVTLISGMAALSAISATRASDHPGSGIIADEKGHVFFTDIARTPGFIGRIDRPGKQTSIYTGGTPCLALNPNGSFSCADLDGWFRRRITPSLRRIRLPNPRAALIEADGSPTLARADSFVGSKGGDEREVAGVKLCWCPAGRFLMGSPPHEPERRPGEDQVEVTLTKGFWMGKYEVTQGQWKRVVGEFPGQLTAGEGDDFPVYSVNFAEAEAYCRKLTERARAAGELPTEWEFRLPTEAQWEYACRAGTTTATSFGDKLSSKQANFQGKPYHGAEEGPSLKRTARVGRYPANPWGLHDMHGNVFEWCRDWYHARLPGGADPDLYSAKATSRVRRGGCWADEGWPCRSAFRLRFEPERRADHIGFRVVAVRP